MAIIGPGMAGQTGLTRYILAAEIGHLLPPPEQILDIGLDLLPESTRCQQMTVFTTQVIMAYVSRARDQIVLPEL